MRYLIGLAGTLALCFLTQTLGLQAVGGETAKSESNYFSTIARIQTGSTRSPKAILLGSSLTGRMADRAARVDGIVNLGCDGGSAAVTLRAIDRGLIDAAPVVVIEVNTLAYDLDGRGSQISEAISGPWFQVGRQHRNLGATSRPTAFAYSWLISKKEGPPAPIERSLPIQSRPALYPGPGSEGLTPMEAGYVDELVDIIDRLQGRGCRVVLVMLPPGEVEGSAELRVARALGERSNAEWWDLTRGLPEDTVLFTDGRHMEAESAAMTMGTLQKGLMGTLPGG